MSWLVRKIQVVLKVWDGIRDTSLLQGDFNTNTPNYAADISL
jgi:hypothetical protein